MSSPSVPADASSSANVPAALAAAGAGGVFAAGAAMGATLLPMAAVTFASQSGDLVGLIVNGGLPLAMVTVGSLAAAGAFRKAGEYLSGEGAALWQTLADSPVGRKAVEISRKVSNWAIPAGAAVMATAGAVAVHQLGYGAVGLLPAMAAIGTAVIAPLAVAKGLEAGADENDLKARLQARRKAHLDAANVAAWAATNPEQRKPKM